MPKKSGKEVAEAIKKVNSGVKILFMSGYTLPSIPRLCSVMVSAQNARKKCTRIWRNKRMKKTNPHEGDEKPIPEKPESQESQPEKKSRLAQLSLAALGVVFGDIATSPIYAIRECFHGQYGIDVTHANVLGILSLMFWALVMIVGLKYLTFVFRANNHGEGGEIALIALIRGKKGQSENRRGIGVIFLGLFAACLLYGDGMITPAISVLSAVEGIGVITPVFKDYIIPITIAILVGLFLIQRQGTARLGGLFGTVIWAKGRRILAEKLRKNMPPVHQFIVDLGSHPSNKINGDAVFFSRQFKRRARSPVKERQAQSCRA